MAETITLPKSGVVLRPWSDAVFADWRLWDDSHDVMFRDLPGALSCAWWFMDDRAGTRDECLAWLDERVLALRAALLPADARERVARAIFESTPCADGGDEWDDFCVESQEEWRAQADAVLAALGGSHVS